MDNAAEKRDPWREKGTVYLLHFERPYKHARHYLGWTQDLDDRLARHRGEKEKDGRGARLVEVVIAAGIGVQLARTWSGDRFFERHVKGRGLTEYCPMCVEQPRNPVGGVETFRANGGTMPKKSAPKPPDCERCGFPAYNIKRDGDHTGAHASERECFRAVYEAALDKAREEIGERINMHVGAYHASEA